jgi:hypothetical protein
MYLIACYGFSISKSFCQNLLGKSCVLPTSKKLCKVKKKGIHLQQFGIIHLPNQDLTYIRNPGRNKIMYVLFHLLKNLHQESFSIIYFFFTLPPRGETTKATTIARAYMRVGRWVLPSFLFLPSWFAKLLEANFSSFARIIWMPSRFAKLLELLKFLNLSAYILWFRAYRIFFLTKYPATSYLFLMIAVFELIYTMDRTGNTRTVLK